MDKRQFEIDQLRKDKIIYASEACAITLICILIFYYSGSYLPSNLRDNVNVIILIIDVGYTVFMGVGNIMRYMKIKKLEKQLR